MPDDISFECDSCRGEGFGLAPWPCPPCKGTGKRLCDFCREKPAEQVIEGQNLACADCAVLQSGCSFCIVGDPTCFHDGRPCCERCLSAFRESGRARDTTPCLPPSERELEEAS